MLRATDSRQRSGARNARRLVTVAALCVVASVLGSPEGSAARERSRGVVLTVLARNLNNPRKLYLGTNGAVYVVEAGTGARGTCPGTNPDRTCLGSTGSILRIADGRERQVVTGLWSEARPGGKLAEGPADVRVIDGRYDVLLQDGTINAHGANALGAFGTYAGDLISSSGGNARPSVLANFAAYEAAHDPDHGAGPGARFGDPAIDSDPYAFTPYRGGLAVADAAGNDLLWLRPNGTISVLAVFPTQTEQLTKALDARIGAPSAMHSISVQSVPTSVAVGPDGALYVGELSGLPFAPATARIWRVRPGKRPSLYATGFTTISDLAFDGKNLLVLEMTEKGLLAPPSPGALIRLSPNGARTVVLSAGLLDPTGLAVGTNTIYIANDGVFPGTGAGPHGELVTIPRSVAA